MADSGRRRVGQMAWAALERSFRWTANLALPAICPVCRDAVASDQGLCGACWGRLTFIAPPHCARCGMPFAFSLGGDTLCGACLREPGPLALIRAATIYGDGVRDLVLPLKHADRLDLAPLMARLMVVAGRDPLTGADALIPVPSHWTRLVRRRANQAAELSRAMARFSRIPLAADVLIRVRATPIQGSIGGVAGRARNVKGAFAVRPGAQARIAGQSLVLVDDVWTTGATVNACAEALLKAGARKVAAITFARVVHTGPLPL